MKKTEVGGVSSSCQMGEIAEIIVAPTGNTVFGEGLLARAIANTPTNELTIRGFA
jgi:hypothetical protein